MKKLKELLVEAGLVLKVGDIISHYDEPAVITSIKDDEVLVDILALKNSRLPNGDWFQRYYRVGKSDDTSLSYLMYKDEGAMMAKLKNHQIYDSKADYNKALTDATNAATTRMAADKEQAKTDKSKAYRNSRYSTAQYEKILKDMMSDLVGDNPEAEFNSGYTYDTARSAIYDEKIKDYIMRTYNLRKMDDILDRLQWDLEAAI